MAGNFDALMDEIDYDLNLRARTLAKAMVEGVDGDLSRHQDAILEMFRKVTKVIMALNDRVDHLNAEISRGKNLRKPAASPDQNPHAVTDDEAPGEMRKGQAVREDFMARALEAQKAGRIAGVDVATAEGCLNAGQPVPEKILRAVMGSDR